MWWRSVALVLAMAAFGARAEVGDAEKGRELVAEMCARCHAWDPEYPWASIGSTPSFMWMARKLDFYRERILSVTSRPPHIAQRFDVSIEDLENILAYIETLKPAE